MSSAPLTSTPPPLLPAKSKPKSPPPQHPLLSHLPHCTSLRSLAQLHAAAVKAGLAAHPAFVTRLLTLCTASGAHPAHLAYARQVFDRVPHPADAVWYNTLLRGYARSPSPAAVRVFVRMLEEGVAPDTYTFVSLLKACAAARAGRKGARFTPWPSRSAPRATSTPAPRSSTCTPSAGTGAPRAPCLTGWTGTAWSRTTR